MSNPSNNPRQLDPSNPGRNLFSSKILTSHFFSGGNFASGGNLPADFFMRPPERPDLTMLNKPGDKMVIPFYPQYLTVSRNLIISTTYL